MPGIGCGSPPVLSFRRITVYILLWLSRSDGAPLRPSSGTIYQFCGKLVLLAWKLGRIIRCLWLIMAKLARPTFRGWRMLTEVRRGVPGALMRALPHHRGSAHQVVGEVLRGVQRLTRCLSDLCSPPTSGDAVITLPREYTLYFVGPALRAERYVFKGVGMGSALRYLALWPTGMTVSVLDLGPSVR
jgi:hypothetical protein